MPEPSFVQVYLSFSLEYEISLPNSRIPCRVVVLLKALLKLVCDIARDTIPTTEAAKSAVLQEATDCLILLDHCSQGQVKVRQASATPFQLALLS